MSCVFGFDVGSRLTGLAIGNTFTASARALTTIAVHDGEPDWTRLDAVRQEWLPNTLVVGLPLTLDGAEQPASRRARHFAAQLQQRYELPVVLVDERHSSQEAARRFAAARAAGLKRRHDAASIDAEAAAVILEHWLSGA
ncbi:Holliday junction resolvase RuvX [Rhodanobacter sp. T12-5]|jgi:putative Holliday junction resolvase|uniref:Holliday junction resolvase RuvX n=1 Tax=Rhodanobacter sp. T12-5 TaxID=2024611 RepID=UPI0011EE74B8|nr:Holliday junction resolvase RuvX [Rhodanobacter sp. T12-5]KAA0071027.1 Holliday junction resolvase RuvX [Rhodanobacter sp. T12-5]HTH68494.1 Holliday junction resolvase RuvX [Rhodanobacter sp.]